MHIVLLSRSDRWLFTFICFLLLSFYIFEFRNPQNVSVGNFISSPYLALRRLPAK